MGTIGDENPKIWLDSDFWGGVKTFPRARANTTYKEINENKKSKGKFSKCCWKTDLKMCSEID